MAEIEGRDEGTREGLGELVLPEGVGVKAIIGGFRIGAAASKEFSV
jgi:hypothetical protein